MTTQKYPRDQLSISHSDIYNDSDNENDEKNQIQILTVSIEG